MQGGEAVATAASEGEPVEGAGVADLDLDVGVGGAGHCGGLMSAAVAVLCLLVDGFDELRSLLGCCRVFVCVLLHSVEAIAPFIPRGVKGAMALQLAVGPPCPLAAPQRFVKLASFQKLREACFL